MSPRSRRALTVAIVLFFAPTVLRMAGADPGIQPASITPVVCKAADQPACVGTPPPVITATPTGPLGTPRAELFLPALEVAR